jgi:hypothetical protein
MMNPREIFSSSQYSKENEKRVKKDNNKKSEKRERERELEIKGKRERVRDESEQALRKRMGRSVNRE